MKKLFFVLMAIAAITMTVCIGCEKKPINEPEPPGNGRYVPPTLTGDTTYPEPHPAPKRLALMIGN